MISFELIDQQGTLYFRGNATTEILVLGEFAKETGKKIAKKFLQNNKN